MKNLFKVLCVVSAVAGILVLINSAIELLYQSSKRYYDAD